MSIRRNPPPLRARLYALLVLISVIAIAAVSIFDPLPGGSTKPAPQLPTPSPAAPAPPVRIDADASSDNEPTGPSVAAHEDQADERPAGVPKAELDAGLSQRSAPGITAPQPVGGAQNYRCAYRPVVNQSSRNGQRPVLFALHYTVSRPGSLDAIRSLFNTPSFKASSTFLLEFSGRCVRLMRNSAKPWTQGAFNGRSISVEIIAMGTESRKQWLAAPIFRDRILAQLMVDTMRAEGIPRRFVDPQGCLVQRAGYTDHDHLECGNTHTDVAPNFPFDVLARQIADLERLTKAQGAQRGDVCNKLRHHRKAFARERPGTKEWEERRARIRTLRARARAIGLDAGKCRA